MAGMILGGLAVLALFGVIAAKYLTAASLQSLRRRVTEAESEARRTRAQFKAAESQQATAGRGINTKDRKKKTLEKSIDKARKTLAELKK